MYFEASSLKLFLPDLLILKKNCKTLT